MNTDAPSPTPPSRRKIDPRFLLVAGALVLLGWIAYRYWHGQHYATTDNAQVSGHVIPIQPRIGGFLAQLAVEANQRVVAGSLLATIDDRDYRTRLAQAEAELQIALAAAGKEGSSGQAEAQVAAARASAAAARSGIDQALAGADRAQKDLERIRSLVEKKMVSPQAQDAAEASARAALAQVRVARDTAASAGEQVSASSAALRAALARVDAARAQRDLAATQLADTRLIAPANGVTGSMAVVPGQLVQAGQPLFNLISDDIWITANFKETDIARIRIGQTATFEIDAYPGASFKGRVASLSPASGALFSLLPPDNATGNFTKVVQRIPVRIHIETADQERPLRPGMSAVVSIAIR